MADKEPTQKRQATPDKMTDQEPPRKKQATTKGEETALATKNEAGGHSAETNKPFRFLDLPVEIRKMIYGHVLRRNVLCGLLPHRSEEGLTTYGMSTSPALLRTCKLVYQEAMPVLYSETTFIGSAAGHSILHNEAANKVFPESHQPAIVLVDIRPAMPNDHTHSDRPLEVSTKFISDLVLLLESLVPTKHNIRVAHLRLQLDSILYPESEGPATESDEKSLREALLKLPALQNLELLPCRKPYFSQAFENELVAMINSRMPEQSSVVDASSEEDGEGLQKSLHPSVLEPSSRLVELTVGNFPRHRRQFLGDRGRFIGRRELICG